MYVPFQCILLTVMEKMAFFNTEFQYQLFEVSFIYGKIQSL